MINISFEGPKNRKTGTWNRLFLSADEDTKTPEEVAGVLSFQGSFTLKRSLRNYHEFSKSAGFRVRSDESLRSVNYLDSNPFFFILVKKRLKSVFCWILECGFDFDTSCDRPCKVYY